MVLWPANLSPVKEASNDDSLVMRLADGRFHFLLTGDIEQRVEDRLVAEHAELASDFLKVPHHGSKTSSTKVFVAAVTPRVAVVSVGESNRSGIRQQQRWNVTRMRACVCCARTGMAR